MTDMSREGRSIRQFAFDIARKWAYDQNDLFAVAQRVERAIEIGEYGAIQITGKVTLDLNIDASQMSESLANLFDPTDHRREGWNDLKAVLVGKLTEYIKLVEAGKVDEAYQRYPLFKAQLLWAGEAKAMRRLISNQQFDPTKGA